MPAPPVRTGSDTALRVTRFVVAELPLAVYLATGAVGAFWVSDDFDTERLAAMAYCGLPLAVLYYASCALMPGWAQRRPRLHATVIATLVLVFTSGVVPLLNAVTAPESVVKRSVEQGTQVVTRDTRRGGLGLLFRARW